MNEPTHDNFYNSWTDGYILGKTEYWKCNHCGALQIFEPFHMNFCSYCGIPKTHVYTFRNGFKKGL